MNIETYHDVEEALAPFVAVASRTVGEDITTQRTLQLAMRYGQPQDDLKVIHVAGTSGKTSTCYYLAALLGMAGKKVGLSISPHITSIGERVQIDGKPLDEATFCQYMSEFLELVPRGDAMPTYFELLIVFALWVFRREGVDYAVLETGLGGLHDSTNICRRADKYCIITDIGLDHTHVLGKTVEAIAAQKAGIIAPNNHVIMWQQAASIMEVVSHAIDEQRATLTVLPAKSFDEFLVRNFILAHAAYNQLALRDSLPSLRPEQQVAASTVLVPRRLEIMQRGSVTIVCDGAHNEQKMYALTKALQHRYPQKKWAVVLAMKQSKDYHTVVKLLAPFAKRVVAVPFQLTQDTPIASIDPKVLVAECRNYNIEAQIGTSVNAAIDQLRDGHETAILVTGSLYAVAEVQ